MHDVLVLDLIQGKTTSKPVHSLPNGDIGGGVGGGVGGGEGDSGDGEIEDDDMFSRDGEEVNLLQDEREEGEELRYGSTAVSSPQPHHEGTSTNQEVTHEPVYNIILHSMLLSFIRMQRRLLAY